MIILIISSLLALFTANFWQDKTRTGYVWTLLFSFCFSPLIACIICKFAETAKGRTERRKMNIWTVISGIWILIFSFYLLDRSSDLMAKASTYTFLEQEYMRDSLIFASIGIGTFGFAIYASRIFNHKSTYQRIGNAFVALKGKLKKTNQKWNDEWNNW